MTSCEFCIRSMGFVCSWVCAYGLCAWMISRLLANSLDFCSYGFTSVTFTDSIDSTRCVLWFEDFISSQCSCSCWLSGIAASLFAYYRSEARLICDRAFVVFPRGSVLCAFISSFWLTEKTRGQWACIDAYFTHYECLWASSIHKRPRSFLGFFLHESKSWKVVYLTPARFKIP